MLRLLNEALFTVRSDPPAVTHKAITRIQPPSPASSPQVARPHRQSICHHRTLSHSALRSKSRRNAAASSAIVPSAARVSTRKIPAALCLWLRLRPVIPGEPQTMGAAIIALHALELQLETSLSTLLALSQSILAPTFSSTLVLMSSTSPLQIRTATDLPPRSLLVPQQIKILSQRRSPSSRASPNSHPPAYPPTATTELRLQVQARLVRIIVQWQPHSVGHRRQATMTKM